ncbi:nuclear transport factor 2 family protein [Rhodococcus sp. G-MC3]|uniref:nuclear transport factor 2 family protein n=1 Tax=Rhodococcus sp. G-MC3 TaxID=3046209 RepID=UPI0024BAB8A7|nr:nuclear transport factor 2 family protein [Rhodococcus sp. G-MC3]MDJ0394868.1 nuclear transport factor 2 family protein [Rhodococcus sp. G-MC3]
MVSADEIRSAVTNYLDTVGNKPSADVAALFADDATLEDPVGTEPLAGREAIEKFYSALDAAQCTTELLDIRTAGNSAAFRFRVNTDTGEQTIRIEPIDIMTFDDQARITSMRAFWSQDDISFG